MLTTWNIASATRPNNFPAFAELVKSAFANDSKGKLEVVGLVVVPGPGCNNYGLMLKGCEKEAARAAEAFCLALQPAKFNRCDGDPAVREGQFEMLL